MQARDGVREGAAGPTFSGVMIGVMVGVMVGERAAEGEAVAGLGGAGVSGVG